MEACCLSLEPGRPALRFFVPIVAAVVKPNMGYMLSQAATQAMGQ